ncbi:MAG: hypothetical protein WA097_01280, partial [Candidatus Hydromicrobium sp.]
QTPNHLFPEDPLGGLLYESGAIASFQGDSPAADDRIYSKGDKGVYPGKILSLQTDNGSEFMGEFDNYLKKQGIQHLFTYTRCQRINGVVERYQRILQEEYFNWNLDLLRKRGNKRYVIPHPKCTTFNKFSAAPLYH